MLTPLGQMQRYDLVTEDADGKFWHVQVKTGWVDDGLAFIRFNTAAATIVRYNTRGGETIAGRVNTLQSMR